MKRELEKYIDQFNMTSHWLEAVLAGISAYEYFEEKKIQKIAIYGMGELANRLMEDVVSHGIEIEYGIDQDVANTLSRISNVLTFEDKWPAVDAIVVTPIHAFEEIESKIKEKCDYNVVSLEEVIWSI